MSVRSVEPMGIIDEIRTRMDRIEERLDAVICVVNKLMEDIYEPEFVQKIDRLAAYVEEGAADSDAC